MPRRGPTLLLLTIVTWTVVACSSAPRPRTPLEHLAHSRAALDSGNANRARWLMESVEEEDFSGEDLERYFTLLAEAYVAQERYWDAFETVQEFPRRFPTSIYRRRVERAVFQSGRRLAATGWTFLGIVSDLADSRRILEHFVTYYPRSQFVPEALRILGEAAFRSREYDLAITRFGQLAQLTPSAALASGADLERQEEVRRRWRDLAGFRIAMSHYRMLEGPEYDAAQMKRAREELTGYLKSGSTNGEFLGKARKALAIVIRWQEERAIETAHYYLRIRRPSAARRELSKLLDDPDLANRGTAEALLERALEEEQKILARKGGR